MKSVILGALIELELMGIRFECPNGHRLNVKEHLAGRRGVCPRCGAKFQIPASGATAGGDPATADEGASEPPNGEPNDLPPMEGSAPPGPSDHPAPSDTGVGEPDALAVPRAWYVRPPGGGQYGPADSEVMRRWLTESRVPRESLVWCEGWPQWRTARDVFLADYWTPSTAPPADPPVPPPGVAPMDDAEPTEEPAGYAPPAIAPPEFSPPVAGLPGFSPPMVAPDSTSPSLERHLRIKRAKRRSLWLILVLGIASIVLLTLLIGVVRYGWFMPEVVEETTP